MKEITLPFVKKAQKKVIKEEAPKRNIGLLASITPIGIEFTRNEIRLGENYCRIYTVIKYPHSVDYCWLSKLTNIPGTIVSISGQPLNNSDFINVMSKAVAENSSVAETSKSALERTRKSKSAVDAEKIMVNIDQENEKAAAFSLQIMVLSRDKEDFKEKCAKAESVCNAHGCSIRTVSNLQQEAYKHLSPTYPINDKISEIAVRPFLLSTFTGGFPYSSSGFCDPQGYYLAKNADNGIILFDLWLRNDVRVNSNITVLGDSGMGKSTAVKHIILSEIARGTKIIIIDPEGEYKEICLSENVNGKWIDVSGSRGGVINPLQVRPAPPDDDLEDTQSETNTLALHLKTLETFFTLYLPSLDDKTTAILNRVLIELYSNFGITWETNVDNMKPDDFPIMSDLVDLVHKKAKEKSRFSDVYENLELLLCSASSGADKGLWNGCTTAESDSCCICLDTKSVTLMGDRVLAAQYFNVLSWCWQEMSKNKTERVMLVADECWMLIDPNCPQSLHFLRNIEKRARKYEGAVVVSTQSIDDFLNPQVKLYGQAVLDMPTTKLIFGLGGKDLQEAKEIFTFNDAQYDLVAQKRKGTALMLVGNSATKAKFEFSDERLAMFGRGGGR